MHAVLYCQFYETLHHTMFLKNLGNEGKLQVSSCRCLLRQNDPQDEYLGDIFYRTVPIPQWRALDQTLYVLAVLSGIPWNITPLTCIFFIYTQALRRVWIPRICKWQVGYWIVYHERVLHNYFMPCWPQKIQCLTHVQSMRHMRSTW